MANIKSAKKRAKQTVVRNERNVAQRSMLRTAVKKVIKALDANDATAEAVVAELGWTQPWYLASAIGREGTWPIMLAVQAFFDRLREDQLEAAQEAAHAAGGDA